MMIPRGLYHVSSSLLNKLFIDNILQTEKILIL